MNIEMRTPLADDVEQIVEVISQGLEPDVLQSTIYGCHGIASYIKTQLAVASHSDVQFLVASVGDVIAGIAEFRLYPRSLFLNYISVRPAYRRWGLGRALVRAGTKRLLQQDHIEMALDVFDHNTLAKAWYHRLGFVVRSSLEWWTLGLPALSSESAPNVLLSGCAQAAITHKVFGFSTFTMKTTSGTRLIGQLGDSIFRLTDRDSLVDPEVLPALSKVNPAGRVLSILPSHSLPDSLSGVAARLFESHRMAVNLEELQEKLDI